MPGLDRARLVAGDRRRRGRRAAGRRPGGGPGRVGAGHRGGTGTGAGDAFVGGLVVGLLAGLDRAAALRRACLVGAAAATRAGAQPSLPRPDDVDALETR